MEIEEYFLDEESEIENLRDARKKMKSKDFEKLINKKDLTDFELDELFM